MSPEPWYVVYQRSPLDEFPEWHYAGRYRLEEDAEEAARWADCPTKIELEYS